MKKAPRFKKTELLGLYTMLTTIVLGIAVYAIVKGYGLDNRILQFMLPLGWIVFGVCNYLLTRFVNTKQQEIELNDERNVKIREKSAYNTFFLTLNILAVAVSALVVLEMWFATIITIGVMTVHVVSFLVFRRINNKNL